MKITIFCLCLILWIWFFRCIKTYQFKKLLLVEGMGIKSAEFVMLLLFSFGMIAFLADEMVGKWFLLTVLLFWITVQFFCHWKYTIFGASVKKIEGYNKCFAQTIKLLPASNERLIPDFYHILLHSLIILLICFMVV